VTKDEKRGVWGKLLRWLVPLSISATAIWLVLRNIDLSQFVLNLSQISLSTLILATIVYFASFSFRAFSWYILLRRKVSYKDAFFTMGAGYLLNNLFPFRLGEIGRAILLDNPKGPTGLEVLSSVLVERIFDVFLAAVFVLATLPRILGAEFDQRLITAAFILTLLGMGVLYTAARLRVRITAWLEGWGKKENFVRSWVAPKASQVLEGLSVLNHPLAFLVAFGSLTISWFLAFAMNFIIFSSLFSGPSFWWMIFVLSTGAFGMALPSAPAGLGVFEGAIVAAFGLLGVGADLAFTHAVVVHAISFVYASALGLIGLRLRGEAVIALYHRVVNRAPQIQSAE